MYVDGYQNNKAGTVHIVERDLNGNRIFKQYDTPYSFYYSDPNGSFTSIYGEKCSYFETTSNKAFRAELNKLGSYLNIFESDIKPLAKILEADYKNADDPPLHICFFDIEVDFDKKKGFAPPEDPFNEITAISLYNKWEDVCYTLVKAPNGFNNERAQEICNKFQNTHLCTEEEILRLFLALIEDADILSGWNSEGFDIPYVIGRIMLILGGDYARKLCHWNVAPKPRNYIMYEKEHLTYDLTGRVHLDYLQLYRKYTYHEMHSYSLDTIGQHEVGESKVAFEGSLDYLYNVEFEKFIEYSRQDTMLLSKIDDKMQFIQLTNTLAHQNCVLLPRTMGAVGLTDAAIILEAHERGFVIPKRVRGNDDDDYFIMDGEDNLKSSVKFTPSEIMDIISSRIAGGYVAHPKKGLTHWVGSVDITSLYPSIIMAMNISPETLEGQVDQSETRKMLYDRISTGYGNGSFADAWSGHYASLEAVKVFDNSKERVTLTLEEARKTTKTFKIPAYEVNQFVFNNERCITANGTIFRSDIDGVIPELIAKWFIDRKAMQVKAEVLEKINNGIELPTEILKELE